MISEEKLALYMNAGFPIIYLNTFEEAQAEEAFNYAADQRTICLWSMAKGYGEYRVKDNAKEWLIPMENSECYSLENVLNTDMGDNTAIAFLIKDAHFALENANIIAALKELAIQITQGLEASVVMVSPICHIPVELEKFTTIIKDEFPDEQTIRAKILQFIKENDLEVSDGLLGFMIRDFKGLSTMEIENVLALAVADHGCINSADRSLILEQKKQLILKSGILELVSSDKISIDQIGGLEILKEWLNRKAKVLKNIQEAQNFGVDIPKGALIAGVPGCGKSMSAKAAANLLDVPLLKLDMGRIMGKYLGESEANLRKAISVADVMAPCVLWIDELEKAFSGVGTEGGHEVTGRLLGTFLTWMQEKTNSVFVMATANDILKLPPELLRKGRFDEVFYVGLPNEQEREKIFQIHVKRRINKVNEENTQDIDFNKLAKETNGYSGADIEGVVKDAFEDAFISQNEKINTEGILREIKKSHSLSEIMKESLENMQKEYEKRKLKNASR